MHAGRLALALLAVSAAAGCLGVDNMQEFKTDLGAHEVPDPPVAAFTSSPDGVLPGETVSFTAAASQDPLGGGLEHVWSLGDGTDARGQRIQHAYDEPGTYTVRLTVTDARGRSDTARDTVAVGTPNRAPDAAAAVTTPAGEPLEEAAVGSPVRFSAQASHDPDGDPLTYEWHLGDGTTAEGAEARHTYEAPGLHAVTVTVTDPHGASDEATVELPVTLDRTWEESVSAPNGTADHPFPAASGARVVANLSFPAGPLGGNDLDLAVLDASGEVVAASTGATPPGADGTRYEEVTVEADAVDRHGPGAWTAQVQRESGADVDYTLRLQETFPAAG